MTTVVFRGTAAVAQVMEVLESLDIPCKLDDRVQPPGPGVAVEDDRVPGVLGIAHRLGLDAWVEGQSPPPPAAVRPDLHRISPYSIDVDDERLRAADPTERLVLEIGVLPLEQRCQETVPCAEGGRVWMCNRALGHEGDHIAMTRLNSVTGEKGMILGRWENPPVKGDGK